MDDFYRIKRLPPYVFSIVNDLKIEGAGAGRGHHRPRHGQPRHADAQAHRRQARRGGPEPEEPPLLRLQGHHPAARGDAQVVPRPVRGRARSRTPRSIATIGAKEGMAHLALAVLQPGDGVLVPNPTYPIHAYSVVIADGDLRSVPLTPDGDFFARLAGGDASSRGRSRRCWSCRSRTTRPRCAWTARSSSASSSSRASTG